MQKSFVTTPSLLYKKCAEYALSKGIIIADTKFEFGLDENGNMVIGDEMLTPDSSRFWPAEGYEPGHGQPSFDKQFARDWLKANPDNDWTLPQEIVDKTIAKYLQAYKMLTGRRTCIIYALQLPTSDRLGSFLRSCSFIKTCQSYENSI